MASDKVEKLTLREKVYYLLREKIISGDLLPGQPLTLKALSEQFNVSIVPVREALFQLESEHVISRRTNRDYRVSTIDLKQFNEIYRIRNLTEGYIAARACRYQPENAEEILLPLLDSLRDTLDKPRDYIHQNHLFHFTIYEFSRSPLLLEIVNGLWARIGPYLAINTEIVETRMPSFEVHEKMLDTFLRGDEKKFAATLKEDIHYSYNVLKPMIKRLQADPETDFRQAFMSRIS
jgi:DNA-binding GntR family transcriptional regulator